MGDSGGVAIINVDDFKLDIANFKEALRGHWTDVQIHEGFEGNIYFGMTLKGKMDDNAGLTINQTQIGWMSGFEEFAEFLVWFRQYIPDKYELLAWYGDFSDYIQLQRNTTEREIITALTSFRYDFEIFSPQNRLENTQMIGKQIRLTWNGVDVTSQFKDDAKFHWFLHTQQGDIDESGTHIHFDDIDLRFAAKFAVWCRSQLIVDQVLTAKALYYPEPIIQAEAKLTSATTEDELFDFLTKSFSQEKSS